VILDIPHRHRLVIAQNALKDIRKHDDLSIRVWARELQVTVTDLHQAANCAEGMDCKGRGCRIR
jgi:hypothetical protein